MAQAVANMPSDTKKKRFLGEMIRLSETMNGNFESVEGMFVENLLDRHFSMFHGSSRGPQQLSADDTHVMKRGQPPPVNR
jgi:hypothetical protein